MSRMRRFQTFTTVTMQHALCTCEQCGTSGSSKTRYMAAQLVWLVRLGAYWRGETEAEGIPAEISGRLMADLSSQRGPVTVDGHGSRQLR